MRVRPDDELGFRAITVRQPYASQIASGEKPIEYRTWGTDYRGDLLITASANPRTEGPAGCAICVVTVDDVIEAVDGTFEWCLSNPRAVRQIPIKGTQLIWTVPIAIVARLGLDLG